VPWSPGDKNEKNSETGCLRGGHRRCWLAAARARPLLVCLSSLLVACGGGSGDDPQREQAGNSRRSALAFTTEKLAIGLKGEPMSCRSS
jgi:hypothetical protein